MKIMRSALALLAAAVLLVASAPALGRSLDFDGSTGYLVVPTPPGISGATGLTLSVWVNLDVVNTRPFFLRDDPETSLSFKIDSAVGGGGLFFASSGAGSATTSATGGVPVVGAWTHVAITYDSTKASGSAVSFYLDGVLQTKSTDNASGVTGTVAANLNIGRGTSDVNPLDGRVWNLKFWTRPFTREEVLAEMLCYRPQTDTRSLVLWIPMDMGDKLIPNLTGALPATANSGISVSDSTPPVELCGG